MSPSQLGRMSTGRWANHCKPRQDSHPPRPWDTAAGIPWPPEGGTVSASLPADPHTQSAATYPMLHPQPTLRHRHRQQHTHLQKKTAWQSRTKQTSQHTTQQQSSPYTKVTTHSLPPHPSSSPPPLTTHNMPPQLTNAQTYKNIR